MLVLHQEILVFLSLTYSSMPNVNNCPTLVMVPTALVRPSLNTSLWSQCRYSGVLMKRKWTEALSPVRRQSLFMDKMVAVCRMLPQWTEDRKGDWIEQKSEFHRSVCCTSIKLSRKWFCANCPYLITILTEQNFLKVISNPHPWPGIWGISLWDDAVRESQPRTPKWPVGTTSGKPSPCLSLWRSAWSLQRAIRRQTFILRHYYNAVISLDQTEEVHWCFPPTFLRANEAVWPPRTSFTGILLRWIDLTAMGMKLPKGSGPSSIVSFRRMSPRKVVPDTTVPTPWDTNTNTTHGLDSIWQIQLGLMCDIIEFVTVPAQSRCRLSGTQRAGRRGMMSWRRAGWGTSWAGPCSLRSHWRSGRWDTSCGRHSRC